MISRPIGAASRSTTQSISKRRTSRQTCRCRPVKKSGEKCQIASLDRSPASRRRQIRSRSQTAGRSTRRRQRAGPRAWRPRSRPRKVRRADRRERRPAASDRRRNSSAGAGTGHPAVSGSPRLAAKTSRSGQSRFSVSRIRVNHGNRTSIVARMAPMASLTISVVSRTFSGLSRVFWPGRVINYISWSSPSRRRLSSVLHPGFCGGLARSDSRTDDEDQDMDRRLGTVMISP